MPQERVSAAAWRAGAAPVVGLAVVGLVIAGLATSARLSPIFNRPTELVTALHVATGVAFLVTGAIAAVRRPRNRVGLLMVLVGVSWFVIDLQFVPSSMTYTLGNLFGIVTWAVLAQLALSYPSGRLEYVRDGVLVGAIYVWMLLGNLLTEVFFADPANATQPYRNLLALHSNAAQHDVASKVQLGVNILLGVLALAALAAHWRAQSRLGRRALAPVIWASAPIFGAVLALDAVGLVRYPDWLSAALPAITPLAILTLPLAFLAGLVRTNLARLAVGHLVVEIGAASTPEGLRASLARAVGDPTLAVVYRVPGDPRWVDARGRAAELPHRGSDRSYTLLERDGEPVAALVHDRFVDEDPALMASVAATASLAIERERLEAEVRAQLVEVRASRARIVEAADAERQRLQRNLHDGAQQRLVALAMRLSRTREMLDGSAPDAAASLTEASEQLRCAMQELRQLSSGIHPSILVESGLSPALRSLAEVAALPVHIDAVPDERLAAGVEACAYFVVSEAVTNAAKHSSAVSVRVHLARVDGALLVSVQDDGVGGADRTRGSGIAGLQDRAAALGGTLTVESPPGRGTRVTAALPCD
ncbi:MAG: sensor histidine kinase [Candidatus Dormibacteraeota bacterium]|nr:sensor histidine kinase [Candidatus Dormibacteraeota bacterium]